MRRTLHEWIELHGGKFPAYRLRVGSGANPPTVAVVCTVAAADKLARRFKTATIETADDVDDLSGVIEELAADHGWPLENPTLRLHALGEKPADDGASYTAPRQRTEAPTVEGSSAASIQAMAAALIQAMRVNVKTIDVLTETIAHGEEIRANAIEQMLHARAAQNEAEADSMAASLLLDLEQEEPNPLMAAAANTLENIGPMLLGMNGGGGPPQIDANTVVHILESDPELAAELGSDPRIVDLVMRQALKANAQAQESPAKAPAAEPRADAKPKD